VTWAAAAVYLSLLTGKAVPSEAAFYGCSNMYGWTHAPPLTVDLLRRAKAEGITTILSHQ
jgi:hypothetical protein